MCQEKGSNYVHFHTKYLSETEKKILEECSIFYSYNKKGNVLYTFPLYMLLNQLNEDIKKSNINLLDLRVKNIIGTFSFFILSILAAGILVTSVGNPLLAVASTAVLDAVIYGLSQKRLAKKMENAKKENYARNQLIIQARQKHMEDVAKENQKTLEEEPKDKGQSKETKSEIQNNQIFLQIHTPSKVLNHINTQAKNISNQEVMIQDEKREHEKPKEFSKRK